MGSINTDLTRVLSSKYANKWVALNPEQTKIIASGRSPKAVLEAAQKKNIGQPVITLVVKDYGFLIP